MKLIFKRPKFYPADWYENTRNTPEDIGSASFDVKDLRAWFMRWVFK